MWSRISREIRPRHYASTTPPSGLNLIVIRDECSDEGSIDGTDEAQTHAEIGFVLNFVALAE